MIHLFDTDKPSHFRVTRNQRKWSCKLRSVAIKHKKKQRTFIYLVFINSSFCLLQWEFHVRVQASIHSKNLWNYNPIALSAAPITIGWTVRRFHRGGRSVLFSKELQKTWFTSDTAPAFWSRGMLIVLSIIF